ncbi:MAG: hypothetical protein HGA39_09240 [Coriobacteriia bacterium]|nr:hypothetical protein [Coriobacteriia bacterium]
MSGLLDRLFGRAPEESAPDPDFPATLEALWRLADELGRTSSKNPLYVLDLVGLLLVRPLERWDYDCTPLNSLTFAHTGGDGVHFGLLQVEGVDRKAWPIVMTVPGAFSDCNRVIAGGFDEFMAIGAVNGWFTLEQLVYDLDGALEYLATPGQPDSWQERDDMASLVRERLGIVPVPLTRERLDELQALYGPAILND